MSSVLVAREVGQDNFTVLNDMGFGINQLRIAMRNYFRASGKYQPSVLSRADLTLQFWAISGIFTLIRLQLTLPLEGEIRRQNKSTTGEMRNLYATLEIDGDWLC